MFFKVFVNFAETTVGGVITELSNHSPHQQTREQIQDTWLTCFSKLNNNIYYNKNFPLNYFTYFTKTKIILKTFSRKLQNLSSTVGTIAGTLSTRQSENGQKREVFSRAQTLLNNGV